MNSHLRSHDPLNRSRSVLLPIVCGALIFLAITGCGNGTSTDAADGTSSTRATATETSTTAVATTEARPSTASEETQVEDRTDETLDGDGDGSCIEGDWMVSEEELNSYYAALGTAAGLPMTATGAARLQFIDLQFVYDAVVELEMDLDGQLATASADGVATGSYVVADGMISTEIAANSLNVIVNVSGLEIDASDLGNDLLTSFPINDAPYSCDGPTIFFETGADRHPVVLSPYEG